MHFILQRLHITPDEFAEKPKPIQRFIRASMRAQLEGEARERKE